MVPNMTLDMKRVMRQIGFGMMAVAALTLMGCGSSEEAMMEEEGFDDEPLAEQQSPPADQSGDQQALTSFIGAAPKKEEPPPVVQEPVVEQSPPVTGAEGLRTENTSLKQQIVKLEQDTRSLSARLSDTEAKYMAEKERADRAEEAARVAAQSAVISARGSVEAPVSNEMLTAYKDALATFRSREYDAAIMKLEGLLNAGAAAELADNCHYWIGESNYGRKNYAEAVKHFEMVLQDQGSEKLADAHFMLGQSYERLGQKAKAKEHYERVVSDYPMSGNVARAKQKASRL